MEQKKRIAAILLTAVLLLVMLCSAHLIASERGHDCIGENCPICDQIRLRQRTLKNLLPIVCAVLFAAALSCALCRRIFAGANSIRLSTPVALKVKLSN